MANLAKIGQRFGENSKTSKRAPWKVENFDEYGENQIDERYVGFIIDHQV